MVETTDVYSFLHPNHIVTFMARNKDNQDIGGFKPEFHSVFITDRTNLELEWDNFLARLRLKYPHWAHKVVARAYVSVNARDPYKTNKAIVQKVVQRDFDMSFKELQHMVASQASRPENATTKHWLLDCDDMTFDELSAMTEGLLDYTTPDNGVHAISKTLTGYHVVIDHGFDTRAFLEKYPNVTVKRDAELFWKSEVADSDYYNI